MFALERQGSAVGCRMTLQISEIGVTPGPRLKRYRPAAHGRALPFQRKTSHIRVVVDGDIREIKKTGKTATGSSTDSNKAAAPVTNAAKATKEA